MSPRLYRLGKRKASTDRTRARIVAAALRLLRAKGGVAGLTIDAVAAKAGVARMTVYVQFGSKAGLLEALFDRLAQRGLVPALQSAFREMDPDGALSGFVAAFAGFWASDPVVLRRLNALAAIDPDVEAGIASRNAWRRQGADEILRRVSRRYGRPAPEDASEAVDLLMMVTSFHTYDSLAGGRRALAQIAALMERQARLVLGLPGAGPPAAPSDAPDRADA